MGTDTTAPDDGNQLTESEVAAEVAAAIETGVRSRRSSRMNLALMLLVGVMLIAAFYFARAFVVPLLIGILTSYTLRPLVDGLQWMRLPRAVAAALVLLALVGGFGWIGYSLSSEASLMIEKLPEAARQLRGDLRSSRTEIPSALQNVQEAASELQRAAVDASQKPGAKVALPLPATDSMVWMRNYALVQTSVLISIVAQTPIVLLLAYFLLASGDHFRRKLVQFVGPSLSRKKDALRMLEEIDSQIQRYLLSILVGNTLIAIGTWLAFWAMGVEQAGVWGVIAGVLHFIPYLGTVLLAIAAGVAGYLQFGTATAALAVSAVSVLIATVIGMGLMTAMQSRFARVNSAVLFIALLFFGWLWGVAGLLLGAPLVAIAKVICDRVDSLKPVGELLGR